MPIALVFTGHMIDLPDRQNPRPACARRSGARGGDILFHEECRRRVIPTSMVPPFHPDQFVTASVEGAEGGDRPRIIAPQDL